MKLLKLFLHMFIYSQGCWTGLINIAVSFQEGKHIVTKLMIYISAVDISQTKVNHTTKNLVNRGRKYIKELCKERVNSTNLVFTKPLHICKKADLQVWPMG